MNRVTMRLMPIGRRWTWRKVLTFPLALMLYPSVTRDYRRRMREDAPDTWWWADERLFMLGWYVEVIL